MPGYVPPLAAFLDRRLVREAGARLDWAEVYDEFAAGPWRSVPPAKAVGEALRFICERADIKIQIDGQRVYCVDRRLAYPETAAEPCAQVELEPPPVAARLTWAVRLRRWLQRR